MGSLTRSIFTILLVIFLFTGVALTSGAQEEENDTDLSVLSGYVLTQGKRTPVLGAKVIILELKRTEYAEEEGQFKFEKVPAGNYTLKVSASGHETSEFPVSTRSGETTQANLYLPTGGIKLEEIVVREKRDTPNVADQTLERDEVFSLPGANNDPVKAVANLPGVAKTNPVGTVGGLVIRGTSQEESGYYLNSHYMPFLFHFGALHYVFNSEFVKTVNYLPGGYGVRYGNALGGIVEVEARRPRSDRIGGIADLSMYSSFVLLEGPIGDKVAIGGAVRRSFIDFILPYAIPEDQQSFTVSPYFWDYEFLMDYKPSVTNKLELTVFGAYDAIGIVSDEHEDGDDPIVSSGVNMEYTFHRQDLAWTFEPSAKMKNLLTASQIYSYVSAEVGSDIYINTTTSLGTIKEEFVWQIADWNRLTFGVDWDLFWFNVDFDIIRPPKEGDPDASLSDDAIYNYKDDMLTWFGAGYIQDEFDLGKHVRITPGVRFEYLDYNKTWFFDPRLFLRVSPTDDFAIKLGLGQYHQFPTGDELMEEFGNRDLEPENSYQANLGIEYQLPYAITIDVQGFYKYLDNLVAGTDEVSDMGEPYKNTGIGRIYGGELLVRKKLTDFWFGWIAYSYTVSERKDNDDADWRFFDEDQRHNFTIVSSFVLPKGFKIGFRWQYVTGTPYTEIEDAIFNVDTNQYIPIYSDKINGERNEDIHQLDVRVDKIWTFNTWEMSLYLDVQNAYLQPQPFGYQYNYDYTERKAVTFPLIIPSLGWKAEF